MPKYVGVSPAEKIFFLILYGFLSEAKLIKTVNHHYYVKDIAVFPHLLENSPSNFFNEKRVTFRRKYPVFVLLRPLFRLY